jgi:septal ring-binding cell division protein DamX
MSPALVQSTSQLDPSLQHFTDPSFDPADFLNDSLPPLTLSNSQPHASRAPAAVPLTDLSSRIQSLLSQVGSQNVRLSSILTQITDEILRSGGRLAYEVEVLRGESIALSDALAENLSGDIAKFASTKEPAEEAGKKVTKEATEAAETTEEATEDSVEESAEKADAEEDAVEEDTQVDATKEPLFITQLRTLSQVRARLEEVVQTFGDAMEWPLPPSELSLTSSFISVSAPEPGSESYSREERGQEVAKKLRTEITELLDSKGGGEDGLAAAAERLQVLRTLGQVWKGTSEEKARNRFLDSLSKSVEDRRKALDAQRAKKGRAPTTQAVDESSNNDTGGPGGGLFRNLQRIRDEIYLE